MAYTLADLDAMSLSEAQALPFVERDRLLAMMISDGRRQSTDMTSYRTGLYCDYFEEDLMRMLKVRAVRITCRGTTASGFDGVVVGETEVDQYRAAFRHLQVTLQAAGSSFSRVVSLVIFLTNMDNWPSLNEGLPGICSRSTLPGGYWHYWIGPKTSNHRNSRVHRLSRRPHGCPSG